MVTKAEILTFVHFIDYYWHGLNRGGTFTLEELIDWVKENEERKYLENLSKESAILKDILAKEDWEIDHTILDFVMKNRGRNKMKRIINCLLMNL